MDRERGPQAEAALSGMRSAWPIAREKNEGDAVQEKDGPQGDRRRLRRWRGATGAAAAIALPPQIAVPNATRIAALRATCDGARDHRPRTRRLGDSYERIGQTVETGAGDDAKIHPRSEGDDDAAGARRETRPDGRPVGGRGSARPRRRRARSRATAGNRQARPAGEERGAPTRRRNARIAPPARSWSDEGRFHDERRMTPSLTCTIEAQSIAPRIARLRRSAISNAYGLRAPSLRSASSARPRAESRPRRFFTCRSRP